MNRAAAALGLVLVALGAPAALAGQDSLSRAFDLERRGSYAQAAELYGLLLKGHPADIPALLGLERSLAPLNREADVLPAVRAALRASPGSVPIYGVGLRAYAAANLMDSLPRLVEGWSKAAPGDETPYREWAAVSLQRRDRSTARKAYLLARERLGKPEVLAAEVAQLATADGDWPVAVREWVRAVRQLPGYRSSAASSLGQSPATVHPQILEALGTEEGPAATRLGVELRARWGDPLGAFESLRPLLTGALPQQVDLLQTFLELARLDATPAHLQAQGRALEALAERWPNAPQRARYRLESARAYADAGDRADARRMLGAIAADSSSGAAAAAGASATLVDLLVLEGRLEDATAQLERYRSAISVEEFERLRRGVAAGWARQGDLARGEALLAADSSVDALALRGRFRLYAGDLAGASEAWRQAGPFAGDRAAATERSSLLALIQPITEDSLPALGAALRQLDGGDSLAAAQAFEAVGSSLPADGGRAEVLLFAGRVYAALHKPDEAERTFRAAAVPDAPAAAAAALLELGRLLLAGDRREQAIAVLEQMILDHADSPLVPQARRLLDQARNAVPRT